MRKLLTFTWKQLHTVYANKGLLLFIFLTPLALATIIGLAFGSRGNTITISHIPVAVVNLDQGDDNSNYGATIASILLSQAIDPDDSGASNSGDEAVCSSSSTANNDQQQSLDSLFDAVALDDPQAAREAVAAGTYRVAVIIPEGFTTALAPNIDFSNRDTRSEEVAIEPTHIEIYGNSGSPISSVVVRSVTQAVTDQIVTGAVTINATVSTILSNPLNSLAMVTADDTAFADFSCAFIASNQNITLERMPLNDVQAQSSFVQVLVAMGAAQAVFFAIFTMNNALLSIYNDKRTGVLQRLLMTPTPRLTFIGGKILGSMVLVFLQVGLLLIGLTMIASLVSGHPLFIWGNHPLLLLLHTLAVGLAVAGLGVFVVGIARTPEQASIFGTLAAMAMGILGGAFGFSLGDISKLSIIHWGVEGYERLSGGNTDIGLHLLVLFGVGTLLFVIGTWLFNRQVEI